MDLIESEDQLVTFVFVRSDDMIRYYSEMYEIKRGNEFAAGIDLPFYDPNIDWVELHPGDTMLLKTGVYLEIPYGYEGHLDNRSSTSKLSLALLCHTIDCDFRGNIKLAFNNVGKEMVAIPRGAYLAQIIIKPIAMLAPTRVASLIDLSTTTRGDKGFGHTGNTIVAPE